MTAPERSGAVYEIAIDRSRRLVRVVFGGAFWDAPLFERYRADCLAAVVDLHCSPGEHMFLIDLTTAVVQSQEVVAAIQAFTARATARRIAFVVGTGLTGLQAKRLQVRDGVRVFADIHEAEGWLLGVEAVS